METKKLTGKTFGKSILVGIVLSTVATGIGGGLTDLGSYKGKRYGGDCEVRGTGQGGVITENDLRNKLKCDLQQVGYREESLNVLDDELLSLHEKEFGVRKGEVYITQVEPYMASIN